VFESRTLRTLALIGLGGFIAWSVLRKRKKAAEIKKPQVECGCKPDQLIDSIRDTVRDVLRSPGIIDPSRYPVVPGIIDPSRFPVVAYGEGVSGVRAPAVGMAGGQQRGKFSGGGFS